MILGSSIFYLLQRDYNRDVGLLGMRAGGDRI